MIGMDNAFTIALARLAAFRASWNAGDVICDDSNLTADDLDLLIEQLRIEPLEWAKANPTMPELR